MIDSRGVIAAENEREFRWDRLTADEQRDMRRKVWDGHGLDYAQARELAILRLVQAAEKSDDLDLLMLAREVRDESQPHELKEWELIDKISKRGNE